MPHLEFLPQPLDMRRFDSWAAFRDHTHEIFIESLLRSRIHIAGKRLVFDQRQDNDGFYEAYWHLSTRIDKQTGDRLPEPQRMERIVWVEPLIQNRGEPGVSYFTEPQSGTLVDHYMWAEQDQFVVIAQEKRNVIALKTAFCVDTGWMAARLTKKRQTAAQ